METYNQLKAKVNNIQSTFTSTDLITRLASKEIYDYCMLCVIELEEIAMTSKTLNEKLQKEESFIKSFLGSKETEYLVLESKINNQ